jgi:hypothetical protein
MEITIRLVLPELQLSGKGRLAFARVCAVAIAFLPAIALASDVFGDVPNSLPQHDAINRVYAAGIMRACTGSTPPNFCPNDPVLRAQQASQWDRALGLNGSPAPGTFVSRARSADISSAYRLTGPSVYPVDTAGAVGLGTAIAIGFDGLPLIAYFDNSNADLKTAHCSTPSCSVARLSSIDTFGGPGDFPSVAIGTDGLGLISYQDASGSLSVMHCSDAECSTAIRNTPDPSVFVGGTAITIGTDGLGLIAYYDATNMDLKVAHCANLVCGSAGITLVDAVGDVGSQPSITTGSDGFGLIAYYDATNLDLRLVHCANASCSAYTKTFPDSTGDVGGSTAITVGTDGFGIVAYLDHTNGDLRVAHCTDLICLSPMLTTVDSAGDVGYFTGIAIGEDGLPLISYLDNTNHFLKVAHCSNTSCTAVTSTKVDAAVSLGFWYTSIAVGGDGLGVISYYDATNADLKVAHCPNLTCTPVFHATR